MSIEIKVYTDAHIDAVCEWWRIAPAISPTVLVEIIEQLRRDLNAARCGPKTDGHNDGDYSTAQLIESLREHATRGGVPTYRCMEILAAADRLAAMFNAFVAPCPHEIERDHFALRASQQADLNASLMAERDTISEQAHDAARERDEARERVVALENKCALLSASLKQSNEERDTARQEKEWLNGEIIELRRQLNDARNDLAMERLGKEAASA